MKIIVVCPISAGLYKDDTEMFCEGLEKHFGVEIVRAEMWCEKGKVVHTKDIDYKTFENADAIWSPYEPLIYVGLVLKENLKIPVVGHWEVIPPTRIPFDEVEKYFIKNTDFPEGEDLKKLESFFGYKYLGNLFEQCDLKTITGLGQKYQLEKLIGKKIEEKIFIKPYPLDTELLDKHKKENVKEKNQIISVCSLREHKKANHVIKAVSLMKNKPDLIIVGRGPEEMEEKYKKMAKDLGVNLTITGLITDEEKVRHIQESMFAIHPWACLPVGECTYLGKVSINYDDEIQRDRLVNMPVWVENNNVTSLAKTAENLMNKPEERKKLEKLAYKELMEERTYTLPIKSACNVMFDLFTKVIKEKEKEQNDI